MVRHGGAPVLRVVDNRTLIAPHTPIVEGQVDDVLMEYLVDAGVENYKQFIAALAHLMGENPHLFDYGRKRTQEMCQQWFGVYLSQRPAFLERRQAQQEAAQQRERRRSVQQERENADETHSQQMGALRRGCSLAVAGVLGAGGVGLTALAVVGTLGRSCVDTFQSFVPKDAPAALVPEQAADPTPVTPVKWNPTPIQHLSTFPELNLLSSENHQMMAACGAEGYVAVECEGGAVYHVTPRSLASLGRPDRFSDCLYDNTIRQGTPFGECGGSRFTDWEVGGAALKWENIDKGTIKRLGSERAYHPVELNVDALCAEKREGVFIAPVVPAEEPLDENCAGRTF